MSAEDDFCYQLGEDKTWRIKELSEIVRACNDATGVRRDALMRASVPVLYAHWEGYFVFCANLYLNFIADKRLKMGMLRDEFWALSIRKKYKYQQMNSDIRFYNFVKNLRNDSERVFKKGIFERINGSSNLRSEILNWCCIQVGISAEAFDDYLEFLDEKLVARRNFIAHGESMRIDLSVVSEYRDNVVDMMRITENEFENAAVTAKYLLDKNSNNRTGPIEASPPPGRPLR
jgi:MAE_28990/MAE_18760-like HEPN